MTEVEEKLKKEYEEKRRATDVALKALRKEQDKQRPQCSICEKPLWDYENSNLEAGFHITCRTTQIKETVDFTSATIVEVRWVEHDGRYKEDNRVVEIVLEKDGKKYSFGGSGVENDDSWWQEFWIDVEDKVDG